MTPENSNDSFRVDSDEDDNDNDLIINNSFSDDENNFNILRDKNNDEIRNSKKNLFSIDNILGLDKNKLKHNNKESDKYFIRPIPLIPPTTQEISISAFKKKERFYYNSSLALNSLAETPSPSSVPNQNGGYLYANWIELQSKANIAGTQGNFLFGYHGNVLIINFELFYIK